MEKMFFSNIDLELIIQLTLTKSDYEKYLIMLKREYGYSLSKKELSIVLRISVQTIDRRLKEGYDLPNYMRSGDGKRASYYWPVTSVARYLTELVEVY